MSNKRKPRWAYRVRGYSSDGATVFLRTNKDTGYPKACYDEKTQGYVTRHIHDSTGVRFLPISKKKEYLRIVKRLENIMRHAIPLGMNRCRLK